MPACQPEHSWEALLGTRDVPAIGRFVSLTELIVLAFALLIDHDEYKGVWNSTKKAYSVERR